MKCFDQIASIGLDPAGLGFNRVKKEFHLDKGDAKFVDIIHTDSNLAGSYLVAGDADFYPNGGKDQPGCRAEKGKFLFSSYGG